MCAVCAFVQIRAGAHLFRIFHHTPPLLNISRQSHTVLGGRLPLFTRDGDPGFSCPAHHCFPWFRCYELLRNSI